MEAANGKMVMIQCVFKGERLFDVQEAMESVGVEGMTVWEVKGHGRQKGHVEHYRGLETKVNLLPKVMVEIVVPEDNAGAIVEALANAARTGEIGDGKVFILPVNDVIRVRTGERGAAAV